MNEEAEKMNEANEFFKAMMDACKRLQVEQKVVPPKGFYFK